MKAIMLAAGRGRRLMPLTAKMPKCLVKIGGQPILYYSLRALQRANIKKVIIVTGYRSKQIVRYALSNFPEISFNFLVNKRYLKTNDIYSLYLARKFFKEDLIVMDSDVFFHPEIPSQLVKKFEGKNAICLRKTKCGKEEMKVSLKSSGDVLRMSKTLSPKETAGEFMGISLFSQKFLKKLDRALAYEIGKGNVSLDREVAIEKVIQGGEDLCYLDVTYYPTIEIDFPSDLKQAEKIIQKISSF